MKKDMIFCAVIFAAASCSDIPPVQVEPKPTASFTAVCEGHSKVAIDDSYILSWEKGDEILVSDGKRAAVFRTGDSGTQAEFRADGMIISAERTYTAVWPASAAALRDGVMRVNVPAQTEAAAGVYPPCPAVALSGGAARNMLFSNVCGLISFDVTGKDVKTLIFEGAGGETLSGSITIEDFATGGFTVSEPSLSVSLTSEKGIAPGRYYAAVLPQTFSKGMKVTLVGKDGSCVTREYEAFTLGRSMYVNLDRIDEGRFLRYVINDAQQLQAFLDDAPLCEPFVKAVLASDIYLDGKELAPAASYRGTFDGDGFGIHGWNSTCPLFGELGKEAVVKNLGIGATCTFTIGSGESFAPIAAVNHGKISACVNNADIKGSVANESYIIGGIAALSDGSIENCINRGVMDISGTLDGAGGIVGRFSGNTENPAVSGCTNEGSITLSGTVPAASGIAARSGSGGAIRSCKNNGSVRIEAAGAVDSLFAGGIAAASGASIENCTNTGSIVVSGNAALLANAGGIAGRCTAGYIHACTNSGGIHTDVLCPDVSAAGVAGWCSVPVRSSTRNEGNVLVEDRDAGKTYAGGVIGYSTSTYSDICNSGEICVNVGPLGGQAMLGGIAGYMNNSSLPSKSLITGQNSGKVRLCGGKGNESKDIFYVAGVVGNTSIPNVSHSNTTWASCNTNHGEIETDVPLTVYVGGVFGRVTGSGIAASTSTVSGARNDGSINVTNPGKNSCIGGVVGRHGRGMLGNANSFGQAGCPASLTVTGADSSVSVGTYAGHAATDNGGNYPACCMYVSGFSCCGSLEAHGATAGVLIGKASLTGNSTSNGIMLGTSASERPKISVSFNFNGVTIDSPASEAFTVNTFFGKIEPSTTTTRTKTDGSSLKNVYYFCTSKNNTEVPYTDGLQQF